MKLEAVAGAAALCALAVFVAVGRAGDDTPHPARQRAAAADATTLTSSLEGAAAPVVVEPEPAVPPWRPDDAPPFPAEVAAQLDAVVSHALGDRQRGAHVVGVLHRDAVWTKAYGQAQLKPPRPATLDTSFRLASITKVFTAVAALRLAERGVLDLDAPVQRYVPTFPEKPWPLTTRHLLMHHSGIPHYQDAKREGRLTTPHTTAQALALFSSWELTAPPGSRFVYSSYGYNLAGAAIEGAAGDRYAAVLDRELFHPLQMDHTVVEVAAARAPNWASGYKRQGARLVPSDVVDISSRFAGGGTRGTVPDLLRFGRALLRGQLLAASTLRAAWEPSVATDGTQADYGTGFAVYPQRGHLIVAHAGGQPETSSLIILWPEHDLVVAVLANVEGEQPVLSDVAASVAEVLLEGGLRRRGAVAAAIDDDVAHEGFNRAFTHGLFREALERRGGPSLGTDADVDAAFARFDAQLDAATLRKDPAAARQAFVSGHHPANGRTTLLVGRAMAAALRAHLDDDAFHALHAGGPLAFFAAYVALCERAPCPAARTFSPSLRARVVRLEAAWQRSMPLAVRRLRPEDIKRAPARAAALLAPVVGAPIHGDFATELGAIGTGLVVGGRKSEGLLLLELSTRLHPRAAQPLVQLAQARVMTGDVEGGRRAVERAQALPGGAALFTPRAIAAQARRLKGHAARAPGRVAADAEATWRALASEAVGLPASPGLGAAEDDDGSDAETGL